METTLTDKKRKILRRIFGVLSLSSALFVFQACYGTPKDMGSDVYIQGVVKSKTTNQPIPGIKVSILNQPQYELTDQSGTFKIYSSRENSYTVRFEDIGSNQSVKFLSKDTVIVIANESTILNVSLNAK
ncbi:MAG: carboxypeptidase-like regulatory domain-containing protein [Prolixibacteraceae bacterium]|jgi:CarboxypepD_reg-like domain